MLSVSVSDKKRKMARLKVFQVCLLKRRSEENLEKLCERLCSQTSARRGTVRNIHLFPHGRKIKLDSSLHFHSFSEEACKAGQGKARQGKAVAKLKRIRRKSLEQFQDSILNPIFFCSDCLELLWRRRKKLGENHVSIEAGYVGSPASILHPFLDLFHIEPKSSRDQGRLQSCGKSNPRVLLCLLRRRFASLNGTSLGNFSVQN